MYIDVYTVIIYDCVCVIRILIRFVRYRLFILNKEKKHHNINITFLVFFLFP